MKDSELQTNCGTPVYKAPELLGLQPKEGTSYTISVDMWSLGILTHELLTSEIPFLSVGSGITNFSEVDPMVPEFDTDLIYKYCRGLRSFPIERLQKHRVGKEGIHFVMQLLAANPSSRISAKQAIQSAWLSGENGGVNLESPRNSHAPNSDFFRSKTGLDGLKDNKSAIPPKGIAHPTLLVSSLGGPSHEFDYTKLGQVTLRGNLDLITTNLHPERILGGTKPRWVGSTSRTSKSSYTYYPSAQPATPPKDTSNPAPPASSLGELACELTYPELDQDILRGIKNITITNITNIYIVETPEHIKSLWAGLTPTTTESDNTYYPCALTAASPKDIAHPALLASPLEVVKYHAGYPWVDQVSLGGNGHLMTTDSHLEGILGGTIFHWTGPSSTTIGLDSTYYPGFQTAAPPEDISRSAPSTNPLGELTYGSDFDYSEPNQVALRDNGHPMPTSSHPEGILGGTVLRWTGSSPTTTDPDSTYCLGTQTMTPPKDTSYSALLASPLGESTYESYYPEPDQAALRGNRYPMTTSPYPSTLSPTIYTTTMGTYVLYPEDEYLFHSTEEQNFPTTSTRNAGSYFLYVENSYPDYPAEEPTSPTTSTNNVGTYSPCVENDYLFYSAEDPASPTTPTNNVGPYPPCVENNCHCCSIGELTVPTTSTGNMGSYSPSVENDYPSYSVEEQTSSTTSTGSVGSYSPCVGNDCPCHPTGELTVPTTSTSDMDSYSACVENDYPSYSAEEQTFLTTFTSSMGSYSKCAEINCPCHSIEELAVPTTSTSGMGTHSRVSEMAIPIIPQGN